MSQTPFHQCDDDPPARRVSPAQPLSDDSVHAFGFDLPEDEWVERVHAALTPETGPPPEMESRDRTGEHIGPYELLGRIGSGGMGTVWRARRADKRPDRVVALKLIRRGMDSANTLRRFRLEEQVLARLVHPNIARLYDGGTAADGRPYLVMEFVEGLAIDRFAERKGLTLEQRLELFRQVCEAVRYAHGMLVLHRDIKPSNIVVAPDGTPKLLDFGIAKILDDADDAAAGMTATEHRVLTPRYASPEQIRGEPLTTATDVYSLGVVLYELLTGCSPYGTTIGTRGEMERAVLEHDVLRPSLANSESDGGGHGDVRRRQTRLRGDLDTIVVTALQKQPERRYASAEVLAVDIDRHLRGLPISAAADSLAYRASRFVRRNKGLVASLSVSALALLAATGVATTFALREVRARAEAEQRTRVAESINAFLNQDLLSSVSPKRTNNPDLTMREALDRAAETIEGRFDDDPLVEASIRHTIGDTYRALGLPREAIPQLETASALYDEVVGPSHSDARVAKRDLVAALFDGSRSEEALPIAEELLELDIEAAGDQSADAMSTRHLLGQVSTDAEQKQEMFRQILAWRRENLGDTHQDTLSVIQTLANEYLYHNRLEEAEPLIEEIWETSRRQYDESHPRYLKAMNLVSSLYGKLGRDEEAFELLRESVRIHRETKPENFFGTGIMLGHLGQCLIRLERFEEAESAFLEAYTILSDALGPEAGWTKGVARLLGDLYEKIGDAEKAARWREHVPPKYERG